MRSIAIRFRFPALSLAATFLLAAAARADTAYSNVFTIDLRAATCTLSCSAEGPGSGPAGSLLSFGASAVPADCAGSVSYRWTFGDGASSTQQNPIHAYLSAGTFAWSMTAATADATCTRSGSVDVTAPLPVRTVFLPSSAYRAGENGAQFRTDVRILNPSAAAVTVSAWFFDQATSATYAGNPFRIEARNQASFDNVLLTLFGRGLSDGAYGPIRFEATGPIVVGATVNNVNACGSGAASGQWLPGIGASEALKAGVIGQLAVSATSSSGFRTNLVVVNPANVPATAIVKVRRGGGEVLATETIGPLPPNGFRQVGLGSLPGVAGTTDTNLWLEFTSDQPLFAYATVIHNVSGDSFAVMANPEEDPGNR